ncbi:hypothetical protein CPB84DRAFT_1797824, partial [Gymnopilus junonius]
KPMMPKLVTVAFAELLALYKLGLASRSLIRSRTVWPPAPTESETHSHLPPPRGQTSSKPFVSQRMESTSSPRMHLLGLLTPKLEPILNHLFYSP